MDIRGLQQATPALEEGAMVGQPGYYHPPLQQAAGLGTATPPKLPPNAAAAAASPAAGRPGSPSPATGIGSKIFRALGIQNQPQQQQ